MPPSGVVEVVVVTSADVVGAGVLADETPPLLLHPAARTAITTTMAARGAPRPLLHSFPFMVFLPSPSHIGIDLWRR